MDPDDAKQVPTMLQDLEVPLIELSKWEEGFIASITDQWERFNNLSDRQFEILSKIWNDKGE